MAGYDPDNLDEQAENAEIPEGQAVITEIDETVASSVYGEEVDLDDPTKKMIEVTADTAPNSDDDGQVVEEAFALPEDENSWLSPHFSLGQFREHYGSVPREGMEVSVSMDEDSGFLSIDY